jgi:hypothetical protein
MYLNLPLISKFCIDRFVICVILYGVTLIGVIESRLWRIPFSMDPL